MSIKRYIIKQLKQILKLNYIFKIFISIFKSVDEMVRTAGKHRHMNFGSYRNANHRSIFDYGYSI